MAGGEQFPLLHSDSSLLLLPLFSATRRRVVEGRENGRGQQFFPTLPPFLVMIMIIIMIMIRITIMIVLMIKIMIVIKKTQRSQKSQRSLRFQRSQR